MLTGMSCFLDDRIPSSHNDATVFIYKKHSVKSTAANKGFSAMLAAEYILIDISLISYSPSITNITELWNIPSAFYL